MKMPEEKFRPNVRPDGPERSPDPRWSAWRQRRQRPEIRELLPDMFPDISRWLRAQDLDKISLYTREDVAPSSFVPRKLRDLKGHQPARLEFRPMIDILLEFEERRQEEHPRRPFGEDENVAVPHTWVTDMSTSLFTRVWDFSADTFGRECFGGRVDERDWTDFILRKLPAELINCASLVARGDPVRHPKPQDPHSYEHLFLAKNERTFLMVGTLSKLLQLHVFNSLLFGARPDETRELHLQDRTTLHTEDGYQRNFARTNVVRQYFTSGRDLEPHLFWEEVDRVTMGILDLLLPMINFLGFMSPRTAWPPLTEVHQNLHKIVAEAAKLTNGIRVSRSICLIDYPLPGDLSGDDHEHASAVIYDESKQRAEELDAKTFGKRPEVKDWETRRSDVEVAARRQWKDREAATFILDWERRNPRPVDHIMRAAKVHVVLWPSFTSYFPIRQNTANGGWYNEGEESRTNIKAQLVYYSGNTSDAGEQAEDVTLLQHIQSHGGLANQRGIGRLGQLFPRGRDQSKLLAWLLLFALFVLWLLFFGPFSQRPWSSENVQVIEEHQTTGTTPLTPTTTLAAGAAETSAQPDTLWLSSSTLTTKRGLWPPFFGGKNPSASGPSSSTSTGIPEPVAVVGTGLEAVTGATEPSSQASSETTHTAVLKPAPEASPKSPPVTAGKVTESDWADIIEDNDKHVVPSGSLENTKTTAKKDGMKSRKPLMLRKPETVTKEGSVEHPVSVTKPESIQDPTSVSSPPPPPEEAPFAPDYWPWLDPRHLFDSPAGSSSGGRSTMDPATQSSIRTIKQDPAAVLPTDPTQPSPVTVEEITILSPEEATSSKPAVSPESASSKPAAFSKTGGVTSPEESTKPRGYIKSAFSWVSSRLKPATPSKPAVSSKTGGVTSPEESTKPRGYLKSAFSRVSSQLSRDEEALPANAGPADGSSSPPTIKGDDKWNTESASLVTHLSKWTHTRFKTYTDEEGQVVTVSEAVPKSKESMSSVAPWHRRNLPE